MTERELERMFEQHADAIYRVCRTYLSAADSEDAVQEVFVRLMRASPEFPSPREERGWLIVTACNCCKSFLRWRKRHPMAGEEATECPVRDEYPAEVLELIMSLPEDSRQVVYMHCYEGYSLAEIARLSGVRASTVRSRWFHARRRLQKMLGGEEDE